MSASAKPPVFKNPVVRWIDHRLPIFSFMDHELNAYPTPRNLNYMWSFGSLAGIVLVIMIVEKMLIACHRPRQVECSNSKNPAEVDLGVA